MPPSRQLIWRAGDLFPSMDQSLPEGDLFMRTRAMFPKQQTTAMHMLALIGENGIGRLGYRLPGVALLVGGKPITKAGRLGTASTPAVFDLVRIAAGMGEAFAHAETDRRIDAQLLARRRAAWATGMAYAA